ncbi:MAG TPA: NAD-glutamate dehydrogenase, partial [Pseudolabrys sp.]
MPADNIARDDEIAAKTLLEGAGAALKTVDPQAPASFAAQLYSRTVPEDLLRYGADDLGTLAGRAYALLQEREPGAPKIRCATVDLKESGDLRSIGVVEIVNDDMPFLLDSVMGELSERRLSVRLVAHPVLHVERHATRLAAIGGPNAGARESFIHLHVDGLVDEAACADLTKALGGILAEVGLAVIDWRPMLDRVNGIVAELKNNPPPLPVDELAEAVQFLQWLLADNFTFLGVRNYTLENDELKPDFDNALGIMRQRELRVLRRG